MEILEKAYRIATSYLREVDGRFVGARGSREELLAALGGPLQRDGTCWVGGTNWQGRSAMRISVSGFGTSEADADRCAAAIRRAHEKVAATR